MYILSVLKSHDSILLWCIYIQLYHHYSLHLYAHSLQAMQVRPQLTLALQAWVAIPVALWISRLIMTKMMKKGSLFCPTTMPLRPISPSDSLPSPSSPQMHTLRMILVSSHLCLHLLLPRLLRSSQLPAAVAPLRWTTLSAFIVEDNQMGD